MRPRSITIIVIIALVIVGCFFLYQERDAVYNQLNAWKLIPEPERFTELYFDNASSLPRQAVAHQPIHFEFTISNVEYMTTTYPYSVYFEYAYGGRVDITNGTVTLSSNASATIPVSYTFQDSNVQGSVVVDLPSQGDQSIDFLLPDNN